MKRHASAFICATALLGLSACNGGFTPPSSGQYTGFYGNQEVTAQFEEAPGGGNVFTLAVKDATEGNPQWTFQSDGSDGVKVTAPNGTENIKPSTNPTATDCYIGHSVSEDSVELCWAADEIHWTEKLANGAQSMQLDLTRILTDQVPTLETPARYTLAQLIDRAKTRNFQSVVAFQQMVMGKDTAVNADWSLVPHFNAGDVLDILSGSVYTELKSIGDLVPFLLPSHWFRAVAANDMAAADQDAWEVMDLDGVNQVESFAYAEARDEAAAASLASERSVIANLRDLVTAKELDGDGTPLGEHDALSTLVDTVDMSVTSLKTIQANDLAALARASGFYNPEAITGVDIDLAPGAPSAANPILVSFDSASTLAVQRSIELRQMGDMLAWAKSEANAMVLDWMDPSGDANGGVGLGLPSYIEVGQDQAAVIQAQTDVVKSDLLNNLQTAILQLQQTQTDYQQAVQGEQDAAGSLALYQHNLNTGIGFVMSDLVTALQAQVGAQLALIDAQYGYQLALSRFNRILCQGVYASARSDAQ